MEKTMEKIKFGYYQENDMWVGWLEEFPDYRTQGTSLDELKENLKDLYQDLTTGKIPNARRYGELVVG
jgi:predicted RNase H-like HicB family nuclease